MKLPETAASPQPTPTQPTMKKIAVAAFLASVAILNVSCSNLGTDSSGRRYSMSPNPIQSKAGSGLSYTEARP